MILKPIKLLEIHMWCYYLRFWWIICKIGHEIVNVSREKDNNVLIGTNDARIARELGIGRTDKYYYEQWIPKNEVEIFEERKEMKL